MPATNTSVSTPSQPTSSQPTLLIDASIYIFQYYFSLPDHWFSQRQSWPTAAVYGYTAFLLRLLKQHQPRRIAACFDESLDQCFRNDIYPDYKSSRALPDEAPAFQLKACRKVTELLGIACFSSKRYEADDLLGSLYQYCRRSKTPMAILTRDKDLGQLLSRPQDYLWDYAKDQRSDMFAVQQKMGVSCAQIIDFLALVGDSIDDIPGVVGIGQKTAQQLLQHFKSVDALLAAIESEYQKTQHEDQLANVLQPIGIRGAQRIASNIYQYREQIKIAQQLAAIVTSLPLINSVNDLNKQPAEKEKLQRFCQRMGFPKLFQTIKTSAI